MFARTVRLVGEAVLGYVLCSEYGEGIGENALSSSKLVEVEAGDVLPPQPKKDPSLEVPGDFVLGDLGNGLLLLVRMRVRSSSEVVVSAGNVSLGGCCRDVNNDMVVDVGIPDVTLSDHFPVRYEAAPMPDLLTDTAC